MQLSVSTHINSSPDKVWQAITDFEDCANWINGIIDLEILDEPEEGLVGFTWLETRKMFGKIAVETMWITDCVDGESYTTRAESGGAIYVSKLTVTPQGESSLLTMEFADLSDSLFVNLKSSIMGLFMKKMMIKMLEDDLVDIKKYVELH
jgi:carbon monoxide dehydrogenase subunit G